MKDGPVRGSRASLRRRGTRIEAKGCGPPREGVAPSREGGILRTHGYAQPDDARAHEGEGVIHAGSWPAPCRERVRASNLKGARLRLLDDPIGHDGHRRAGQGNLNAAPYALRAFNAFHAASESM